MSSEISEISMMVKVNPWQSGISFSMSEKTKFSGLTFKKQAYDMLSSHFTNSAEQFGIKSIADSLYLENINHFLHFTYIIIHTSMLSCNNLVIAVHY